MKNLEQKLEEKKKLEDWRTHGSEVIIGTKKFNMFTEEFVENLLESTIKELLSEKEEAKDMEYALLRNQLFNAISKEFKFSKGLKKNNQDQLWKVMCDVTREYNNKNKLD